MARTPANTETSTDIVEAAVQEPVRTKTVIIQRPAGNQDIGQFLGFNSVSGVFPFDKPVEMPADMVDYFRSQKVVETNPGPDGSPVFSYVNQFHIIDA